MDPNFVKARLESLTKQQLINIITNPRNRQYFEGIFREDLNKQSTENLVSTIMRFPNVHIDNNILADFNHQNQLIVFAKLFSLGVQSYQQRMAKLQAMNQQKLLEVLTNPVNARIFKGYDLKGFVNWSPEELRNFILKFPEAIVDSTGRSFNPTYWKARPHQADHIKRLVAGLKDPTNEARVVWDGSRMGLGKTPSAIITAIQLGVRFVIVICPDVVVKKWHDAFAPLGLFDYRICTYAGIKGTTPNEPVQFAKHKPNPDNLKQSEELPWVRITMTGQQGKYSHFYDWSLIPDSDENGLGGTLVIWDEVQTAKGLDSKIGICFNNFIYYLHREPKKYVKCLMLSGGIMEKTDDLPYLMHAFGYILNPTKSELNQFIREKLIPNFKTLMGSDWDASYELLGDGHQKLLRFIRKVVGRQNRFSQIPEPLPYILHKLNFITAPELDLKTRFAEQILIPRFREYVGEENWKPEYDLLDEPDEYLKVYLSILAKDSKYAEYSIQAILDFLFPNPITFQAIQIQAEEIELFRRLNNEIRTLLEAIARGDLKFNQGLLGAIQRILSQLESLKLTPFTELARKALNTHYENGARGSVVICCIRNASVRYFMWRVEAILWLDDFYSQKFPTTQARDMALTEQLNLMIQQILAEYENYRKFEESLIKDRLPLKLKSDFKKLTEAELRALSPEDIVFEYNKWLKYLDISNFKYVCVFVGDIGDPSPSDFDLSSPDPKEWIKESRPISRTLKEEMKMLFQNNSRRVFITNIQTAKEGIDLHDISNGGMHPRTGIISPGIIARYLDQFLGRFVRDGQTSNAIRVIGFIDNFQGETSWEAKFMPKLNKKLHDIHMLHNGESKLDIEQNIEEDGTSILMQIVNEMRHGKPYKLGGDPDIPIHGNELLKEGVNLEGVSSSPLSLVSVSNTPDVIPAVQVDAVQDYFRKNYQATKKSPMAESNQAPLIQQGERITLIEAVTDPIINIQGKATINKITLSKLIIRNNENYFFFDTQYNENPGLVDSKILSALASSMVNNKYYTNVAVLGKGKKNGVLVYRPGLVENGISQPELVKNIVSSTALEPEIDNLGPDDLDFFGFKPEIDKLIKVTIMFDSMTEFRVTPKNPLQAKFPPLLLQNSLTMDNSDENSLLFRGTASRIIAAYYAIRAIIKVESPQLFDQNITIIDPNNVLNGNKYLLANIIFDGTYVIMANQEIIKLIPFILSSIPVLIRDLIEKKVLGEETTGINEISKIIINPPYQTILNIIIGYEPGMIQNGKVIRELKPI